MSTEANYCTFTKEMYWFLVNACSPIMSCARTKCDTETRDRLENSFMIIKKVGEAFPHVLDEFCSGATLVSQRDVW